MANFRFFTLSAIMMVLVIIALGTGDLFAQAPDTAWTRTFGGSSWDEGHSVQQTSDGGYIITGYTESYGAGLEDVYLIKTDSSGNQTWTRTFGGSSWDEGHSVQQTSDGGYIIAGYTESYGAGAYDVYLIKTDSSGNQQWYKTFGGSSLDWGSSVQQTTDGGYIITGYTESYGAGGDVYLIKTDSSGNQQWYKTFGGSETDFGHSVQQTMDGGYIIGGTTYSYSSYPKFYIIKTDANGNQQWDTTKGFAGGDNIGHSIRQTLDGGYITVGYSYYYGEEEALLVRINQRGHTVWWQAKGFPDSYEEGFSVQPVSDGYILVGVTSQYDVDGDVMLVRTDTGGVTVWWKPIGGDSWDCGYSVQPTSDGGYIITGTTESYGAGYWDVYLIKIKPEVGIEEKEPSTSHLLHFVSSFNQLEIKYFLPQADWVRVKVYDSYGRVIGSILDKKQGAGDHTLTWDGRVPQGVYFIHLETSQTKQIAKAIIFR